MLLLVRMIQQRSFDTQLSRYYGISNDYHKPIVTNEELLSDYFRNAIE